MSDKINIREILTKHCPDLKNIQNISVADINAAFKEALEAAIDKCADNADVSWAGTPDRQSILNVKKMIDYD